MIHEGTAGIHAKTLLGRKVTDGKAEPLFAAFRMAAAEATSVAAACADEAGGTLLECAASLQCATSRAERVTAALTAAERDVALVNAHDYLTLVGHTCVAWTWLRVAVAAARGLEREQAGTPAALFYQGKLHTCAFFFRHELPRTEKLAELLESLDLTVRETEPGWL